VITVSTVFERLTLPGICPCVSLFVMWLHYANTAARGPVWYWFGTHVHIYENNDEIMRTIVTEGTYTRDKISFMESVWPSPNYFGHLLVFSFFCVLYIFKFSCLI